jgi:pSer/pThr/pTyr-binding forkhead associated (FHA) protein
MAKVTLFFGNDSQGEFGLSRDEHKIGRARDCDILVDNLGVSRHHCSICKAGTGWKLVDKGSNNGTFLNGEKVNERELKDQDRIILGKFSLVYDAHGAAAAPAAKAGGGGMGGEMTMFVDPDAIKKMQKDLASGTPVQRMMLLVRSGGREVPCPLVKSDTLIGKGMDADVVAKGMFIKPVQAKVIKADNGHRLLALGGLRKVRINGSKIQDAALRDGDIITLAGLTIVYKKA